MAIKNNLVGMRSWVRQDSSLISLVQDGLADSYGTAQPRTGNHMTDYIYCLRKAYFQQPSTGLYIPPTTEELLMFAIGLGLQDTLLKRIPEAAQQKILTLPNNITCTPDLVVIPDSMGSALGQQNIWHDGPFIGELKTTRMSPSSFTDASSLPEGWVRQMGGYLAALSYAVDESCHLAKLLIYTMTPPTLLEMTLEYDWSLILAIEEDILAAKDTLDDCIANTRLPEGSITNPSKSWECKYCRYSHLCSTKRDIQPDPIKSVPLSDALSAYKEE